jgi:nucleotide-binding universal stress UspA family protein
MGPAVHRGRRLKEIAMALCTHVLIPTDGSETAAKAIAHGIGLAREHGARITFFTALPEYELPSQASIMNRQGESPDQYAERSRGTAQALLAPLVQQALGAGVQADMDYFLSDHPAEAIAAAAQRHGCDLIVMGSHGRTGLSALVKGSHTREVLARSGVPTLVYR